MKMKALVTWWDYRNGSDYRAELVSGQWQVWEREWAGVRWYQAQMTDAIRGRIDEELPEITVPVIGIAA
jgi:hypothetical protein